MHLLSLATTAQPPFVSHGKVSLVAQSPTAGISMHAEEEGAQVEPGQLAKEPQTPEAEPEPAHH